MRNSITCLLLGNLTLSFAAISAPTSCQITQSSFTASNPTETTVSVTSNEKRVTFSLQVDFQGTCTSSTGDTSWVSASGARSYYVQGIDSTNSKTGETFYGVEVKDEQDNNAFKYGSRWTDQACVSEEFKGTWTAGSEVCDSTSGTISGTDCRDLFNAVEASICWQIPSPVVCIDSKLVSGTLSAYASLRLVAAGETVTSSPSIVLDLTSGGYYSCSGQSADVVSASAVNFAASTFHLASWLVVYFGLFF
ncbi:unnamed protein product [Cladocopium goreaui]|uniref:Uncharacterized protein n=1 Tax=Cladocopium goreaui TaxID=2562237 RepID=A0A9P1CRL2_9DINO|nr:unnamed protein product [Cladocopium goreaui]